MGWASYLCCRVYGPCRRASRGRGNGAGAGGAHVWDWRVPCLPADVAGMSAVAWARWDANPHGGVTRLAFVAGVSTPGTPAWPKSGLFHSTAPLPRNRGWQRARPW